MADNKNTRKSNRNFSLEKPVERHFDIEKEVEAAPVAAKPVAAPTGGGKDGSEGGSSKKWIIIVLILVALAACAYYFLGRDKGEVTPPESTQVEQNDSTQNGQNPVDTTAMPGDDGGDEVVAPGTDEASGNGTTGSNPSSDNSEVNNAQASGSSAAGNGSQNTGSANVAKPASGSSSVEQMAQDVWDGKYGNNPERRNNLGSDYAKVQKRVNEMRRQGLH